MGLKFKISCTYIFFDIKKQEVRLRLLTNKPMEKKIAPPSP